jgi:hypothetical protein
MAITTTDGIANALGNPAFNSRNQINKASIANATANGYHSLWRATGIPAQGAIPATAALCTNALLGSMNFTNQTLPDLNYIDYAHFNSSNAAMSIEIHDRLAQMGGLVLNVLTSQNVLMNLATLAIPNARLGDSNYNQVSWWLEVYSDGGATASNATINVTYDDDSTGNLAVVAVGGTLRASRLIPLIPAVNGRRIKGINTVILSASTGTAGNFGFTATRQKSVCPLNIANRTEVFDWAQLGRADVQNDSALALIVQTSTTTTGTLIGAVIITNG